MKKRAVSIVLSVLLAAGALAGCASGNAESAASGAVSAVSGTEGAGEGDSSGDGALREGEYGGELLPPPQSAVCYRWELKTACIICSSDRFCRIICPGRLPRPVQRNHSIPDAKTA